MFKMLFKFDPYDFLYKVLAGNIYNNLTSPFLRIYLSLSPIFYATNNLILSQNKFKYPLYNALNTGYLSINLSTV